MSQYPTKVKKSLRFFNGVRYPEVFSILEAYGFTREVLIDGANKIQKAASLRKRDVVFEDKAPGLTARAEEVQSLWFPVTRATLNASFPDIAQAFFDGMVQRKGQEAPLGVTTFVTRVRELESPNSPWGPDSAAARQLLTERGLTPAVIDEAQALLDEWRDVPESPVLTPAETDEIEQAIKAAWDWYVEWSTIARTVLKSKRHLHSLGLSTRRSKEVEDEPTLPSLALPPALSSKPSSQSAIELHHPIAAE